MSTKKFSRSTIKTVKVTCDRCKHLVEGIRGEEFSAGFYDMNKWEEYRRDNERYVCESWYVGCPQIHRAFRLLRLTSELHAICAAPRRRKYSCLCFASRGTT